MSTPQNTPRDGSLRKLVVAIEIPAHHLEALRERFPDLAIVAVPYAELDDQLPDADAVCSVRLTAEQIARAPRLRWLQTMSAGVEHVLTPALVDREIALTNASGVHAINIGEHLMAMMLAFARALPRLVRNQTAHRWRDEPIRDHVFELHGQTLLLVGLGDIALALAERAVPFGMRTIGVRRRPDQPVPPTVHRAVTIERLAEVLPEADHVAICLPLTEQTEGLLDAGMLGRMRPSSYLYNIGRGRIVDQEALIAALRAGRLAGAGLDVTDPEPLPADSPLWDMENVLITAHTSGGTPKYWDRGITILSDNIERFRSGQDLINRIDTAAGY